MNWFDRTYPHLIESAKPHGHGRRSYA
jgi:hypothetical protein